MWVVFFELWRHGQQLHEFWLLVMLEKTKVAGFISDYPASVEILV